MEELVDGFDISKPVTDDLKFSLMDFQFLMELKLELEWLEGESKNLGGGKPPRLF